MQQDGTLDSAADKVVGGLAAHLSGNVNLKAKLEARVATLSKHTSKIGQISGGAAR